MATASQCDGDLSRSAAAGVSDDEEKTAAVSKPAPIQSLRSPTARHTSVREMPHNPTEGSALHFDVADLSVAFLHTEAASSMATAATSSVDPASSATGTEHRWWDGRTPVRVPACATGVRRLPGVLEIHGDGSLVEPSMDHCSEVSRSLPSFLPIDAALDAGVDATSHGFLSAPSIHFSPKHSFYGSGGAYNTSMAGSRWTQMSMREWATRGATSTASRTGAGPHSGVAPHVSTGPRGCSSAGPEGCLRYSSSTCK